MPTLDDYLKLDGDNWLEDDDSLTDEQKALLETRLRDMELYPETSIPWTEAKRRLQERFMKSITDEEVNTGKAWDVPRLCS